MLICVRTMVKGDGFMTRVGFDNDQYISMQSEHIRKRISEFGGKLYLEFGGKLFDDHHASRVLPGFKPDSKLQMLLKLKEQAEIVIVISAPDIESNKMRGDSGITYDAEVLRLIDAFREIGLFVGSVAITQYMGQSAADTFQKRLETLGVQVFRLYSIDGYPYNVKKIVSDEGFGKNDYIITERPLVVVTAPGPGSGKMATCLSQLYHEHQRGIQAGYAKFETFPVWNLPLKHPVNLAYEAATADLNDVNMIDPFHLDAYGKTTVNYNRDVEVFPVVSAMFEKIYGKSPYKSPTDMGVNMVGFCIEDDQACRDASYQEIIRRYYNSRCAVKRGQDAEGAVKKIELLMNNVGIAAEDRPVVGAAMKVEEETGLPGAAIELPDGTIITGKSSKLLGAASGMLLNALKALGGIQKEIDLIAQVVIEPIQSLKVDYLGNRNPQLHTDEILTALAICAATNPMAKLAMDQLSSLRGCEMHSSVMLSAVDENTLRRLGINLTCEPKHQTQRLYHG